MGKLIVIEGTDSSGKETQAKDLFKKIKKINEKTRMISFPNYSSPACEPVKMYLAGDFGENPIKINPYPISAMYAIDRYASFKTDWGKFYEDGGILITDRYVTSNMIHQAAKISDPDEKKEYLRWLEELEYDKIGIPRPDMVLFLNMPTKFAMELMKDRKNKITGESTKDIHEKNKVFMANSYNNACELSKIYDWKQIDCVDENGLRDIEDINNEIYDLVKRII